jgi:ankyrin repeat protein
MALGLGLLLWGTPLFAAAVSGRTETVAALLKAGANANAPGATLGLGLLGSITPLNAAAVNGHTETVLALLEAGANPNAPGV